MIMNWRRSIAAIVALVALGGTAEADILMAGPGYGGPEQVNGKVVCWLFNAGSTNVTIPTRQIFHSRLGSATLAGDTCTVALAPLKTCSYYATAVAGTHTCRAITSGADENISGSIQIYTPADHPLLSLSMKK
jgi:hypothetical protein